MHKAELEQEQNKITYKMGREYDSDMHSLPCGVIGCVSHVGQRGNVLTPRLQYVLSLQHGDTVSMAGDRVKGKSVLQVAEARCFR